MKHFKITSKLSEVLIIVIIVANIYLISVNITNAKYVSEFYGGGSISTANWNVKLKYDGQDISKNYDINLNDTTEKIVPGSKGDFSIEIDATECNENIPIKFEIKLTNASELPPNMIFYVDGDSTKRIDDEKGYVQSMNEGRNIKVKVQWKWDLKEDKEDDYQNTKLHAKLEVSAYSCKS